MQVFKYFYRVVVMPPVVFSGQQAQGKAVIGILSSAQPITDNEQLPFILGHIGSQINAEPEHMDLTTMSFMGAFDEPAPEAANS